MLLSHSLLAFRRFQFVRSFAAATATQPVKKAEASLRQLLADNARILRVVEKRVEERERLVAQVADDMTSAENISRAKKIKEMEPVQHAWDEWNRMKQLLSETNVLLNDPDPTMRSLALEDHNELTSQLSHHIENVLTPILVPPSLTINLGAMIELKSAVGGTESSLFLADLLRMYQRFASTMNWAAQIVDRTDMQDGGVKDAILEVKGEGAYDSLRWESGVHRVQRVPATESTGRVHTSTVGVIVLPLEENEDKAESNNELYTMNEIKIEVMRARGAGGQHVNRTESAVRLTHLPTGITVSMQDERSQHQNKRRAFQVLHARLMDLKITREMQERRDVRRNLVGSVDRSDKIRTYNYAQDRVTDHRIGLTLMNLTSVMEGDGLRDFVDALKKDYEEGKLETMLDEAS